MSGTHRILISGTPGYENPCYDGLSLEGLIAVLGDGHGSASESNFSRSKPRIRPTSEMYYVRWTLSSDPMTLQGGTALCQDILGGLDCITSHGQEWMGW